MVYNYPCIGLQSFFELVSNCTAEREHGQKVSDSITTTLGPGSSLSLIIWFETSFEQKAWTMDVLRDGGRH